MFKRLRYCLVHDPEAAKIIAKLNESPDILRLRLPFWLALLLLVLAFLLGSVLVGNVRVANEHLATLRMAAELRTVTSQLQATQARVMVLNAQNEQCSATLENFRSTLDDVRQRASAPNAGNLAQWLPLIRMLGSIM